MHILIVNDDGPPSNQSSPYIHSLVLSLQAHGHIVSVCLPHTQRSWIGKAHIIGQTVKPTYFRPGTIHQDDGTTHTRPSGVKDQEEWVLVDGTPASCVQIGLYHYFQDKGPIDLVVAGPNYGRNTTAVFALSSGTLGGALEAAICRKKSIAVSYAFFSRNHDPEIIKAASKISTKLIEYLYENWKEGTDLYSINVPLVEGVDEKKVYWADMLQNYWGEGSCFQEVEDEEGLSADEEEQRIREGEGLSTEGEVERGGHKHKHFKWAPRFTDVYRSVEEAGPGNDGWVVKEGFTAVTALKANFKHTSQPEGELKLPLAHTPAAEENSTGKPTLKPEETLSSETAPKLETLSLTNKPSMPHIYALIDYQDPYVQPLILSALKARLPPNTYTLISSIDELPSPKAPFLQISQYETLPFSHILSHPTTSLANSYIIRKALIRKHYLSTTAYNRVTKHPSSILSTNIKPACSFELDYAEFLDDALVEAWELKESWREAEEGGEKEWWILKPGMSDRGQGIRLFSSEEELQAIFDEWEAERPDSDDENEVEEDESSTSPAEAQTKKEGDFIITSHLRHFIAQPYIHPPLLIERKKFHIRTYVVAIGSLKIYVYRPMLALFASVPYTSPSSTSTQEDLFAHLTNTCLQTSASISSDENIKLFSSLSLPEDLKTSIFQQICTITGEIFEAAASGMMVHFQTLPNVFEIFGVDFLIDEAGTAFLLEINAFPDFGQTGGELRGLVEGLWEEVVERGVGEFFGFEGGKEGEEKGEKVGEGEGLVLVRRVELGRK